MIHPILAAAPPWLLQHLPIAVFVFCFGACVGSFLNVVIYRMPAGQSVINPPSRCMTCGARLRFFRENLPILGWFFLRGKCRYCGVPISPQYMIVETMMALIFLGLYVVLFMVSPSTPWWGAVGGWWWSTNTAILAWPAFIALTFMIAGLVAMTVIDARTFTIPLQIPLFITFTAFIAYPLQALLPLRNTTRQTWPIPCVDWPWLLPSLGGMLGVLITYLLLRTGRLRYSFADYDQYVKPGETLADYPHARREMWVELKALAPIISLVSLGIILGRSIAFASPPPHLLQAVGATFAGYLIGGGIMWAIRLLGTLGFGREAMGMGDVHLLAAVGAVLGWFDPIIIFFLAPFSGIIWALGSSGLAVIFRRRGRELPYGPHLAVATLVIILCRPGVQQVWRIILPTVPMPAPGFVHSQDHSDSPQSGHPPSTRPAQPRPARPASTQPRQP